jgi:non-specific serine/threonine protein kinase
LALAVAGSLLDEFPDGVWLAELAPLADPALVPQAVAAPFGILEGPERPLLDALVGYVQPRRSLLVLDNCEHLLDATADLVQRLLASCQHLRILATSREPLHIPGEVSWRVPTLAVPDPERPLRVEELADAPAVRLFVDRAAAVQPTFSLTPGNARAVASICARLDGIPLALELAAARARSLTPEQIMERLEGGSPLLTGGARTAPSLQQTMRAALDWSLALLSTPEQVLFRRLSVFVGGWNLEAAEAACGGHGLAQGNVLDLLDRLVDTSLVVAEQVNDRMRYRLLEPIRQYAGELLQRSEEADGARGRHAAYYLGLAERGADEFSGPGQAAWLARLEREHGNLRAALGWLAGRPESTEPMLRLAGHSAGCGSSAAT